MGNKHSIYRVFFDASVILAGLNSPSGGSAKVLNWVKQRKIEGIISELILDEVIRRAPKIGKSHKAANQQVQSIFSFITPPPTLRSIKQYQKTVTDTGDAHVLAACRDTNSQFLISLDKKHILSLKNKRSLPFKILTPGELINLLSSNP